jgi:hypothetical protein
MRHVREPVRSFGAVAGLLNINSEGQQVISWSLHLKEEHKLTVRFQILTATSMKIVVFWYVAQYSPAEIDRCFRGAYCLHIRASTFSDIIPLRFTLILSSHIRLCILSGLFRSHFRHNSICISRVSLAHYMTSIYFSLI